MSYTKQLALIGKDLRSITSNKRLFSVLFIVPVVLTLVIPTIFILGAALSPDGLGNLQALLGAADLSIDLSPLALVGLVVNRLMPVFFMLIPIMAASVMAASSFVGEKEKRTLETLLYAPLSLRQIFQAKILASFLMSMLVSLSSFLLMVLVVQIEARLLLGSFVSLTLSWVYTLLLLSPAISLIAVCLIVRGSAKAQTMEESQQRAVFLILPVLLLMVGQFTGLYLIEPWLLLSLGLVLMGIAVVFLTGSMKRFDYEGLLR